jgi:hypothetical protein
MIRINTGQRLSSCLSSVSLFGFFQTRNSSEIAICGSRWQYRLERERNWIFSICGHAFGLVDKLFGNIP